MKFENVLNNTHNIYIYYFIYLFIIYIYIIYIKLSIVSVQIFSRAIVFYVHLTVFNILEQKKQEIAFP